MLIDQTQLAVLVVEDDPGYALFICEMLQAHGVTAIRVAERLHDGIAQLVQFGPDIVLLDMNLPDSTGMQTLTTFIAAAPSLPVVILTGLTDETFATAALRSGAQDYLVKGQIDGRMLKRSLRYAIERKKLEISLKQANEELSRRATTDALTGACNRLRLSELLPAEIKRSERHGVPLAIIIFDIDHFKAINDTHGHLAGDQVLMGMARLVQENIRQTDLLVRWGGEEFIIMAVHCDGECAVCLAEKLRSRIAATTFIVGVAITASFGVATFQKGDSVESLIGRTDTALYAAKAAGRNRVERAMRP